MPYCTNCHAWQDADLRRCVVCGHHGRPARWRHEDGFPRLGEASDVDVARWLNATDGAGGLVGLRDVLGGGLPTTARTMLYGAPGIGKSRLAMLLAAAVGRRARVVLAHPEQSESQVGRQRRELGVDLGADVGVTESGDVDAVLALANEHRAALVIFDPIQEATDGVVAGALKLSAWAKAKGRGVLFTCHVTKKGEFSGPKRLPHLVDIVLGFEGEPEGSLRVLRGGKNRYGASGKLAYFEMDEAGAMVDCTGAPPNPRRRTPGDHAARRDQKT